MPKLLSMLNTGLPLLLFWSLSACRHKPDAPNFPVREEAGEPIEASKPKPSIPAEGAITTAPVAPKEDSLAANQTPPVTKEAPPTLDRQTVVVGNGRIEPTNSVWYRFPTDQEELKQIVEYIKQHAKNPNEDFRLETKDKLSYLCLSSENEMEITRLLFDRFYSIVSDSEQIHFPQSSNCKNSKIPDFENAKPIFTETLKTPTYVCSQYPSGARHIFVQESADQQSRYAAQIRIVDNMSLESYADDAREFSLSFGPTSDPRLHFQADGFSLELQPYQAIQKTFQGILRTDKPKSEAILRCRMTHSSPF